MNAIPPSPVLPGRTNTGRKTVRHIALGVVVTAAILAAADFGYRYVTIGQYVESTDDAYVKADSTIVAPKVPGYIAELLVDDNQTVKAGQVVARIDDRDYRTALDQARANLAAADATIGHLDAQLAAQGSLIDQSEASEAAARAELDQARRNDARYAKMASVGYGSEQQAEQAATDRRDKEAVARRQTAAVSTARQQVDILHAQRALAVAERGKAAALVEQAELNLSYTIVTAPIGGTVGARSLRVGQYVQAGTQLLALVPLSDIYVVANFKETQLGHMKAGEPVAVEVDSLHGTRFKGHVESLSPASGQEFSLLPPDNATGNFTKIVQRIPVKIRIDDFAGHQGELRPGMSVEADVDTKQAKS
ncbi:MAG TPA: HlyD family secretion protein [Magnetospirillaceae bacterium]|nr:HlyD family secretion protein [Magnetospirillaceae bacterium]